MVVKHYKKRKLVVETKELAKEGDIAAMERLVVV